VPLFDPVPRVKGFAKQLIIVSRLETYERSVDKSSSTTRSRLDKPFDVDDGVEGNRGGRASVGESLVECSGAIRAGSNGSGASSFVVII
jgi:hypothetical protein